jgi:hypothetical protein
MVRFTEGGVAIAIEVWQLPSTELGSFLNGIPAPLGLGKVELSDGSWETGFICKGHEFAGATDINEWAGWRAWLGSLNWDESQEQRICCSWETGSAGGSRHEKNLYDGLPAPRQI